MSYVDINQAFVRAELTNKYFRTVKVDGGKKPCIDLTFTALDYDTPLKATLWGATARDLKKSLSEGDTVEISASVYRDEWEANAKDENCKKKNSAIKLSFREDLYENEDAGDNAHYIQKIDKNSDAGVFVNLSGEIRWVGDVEDHSHGDNEWQSRSISLCPYGKNSEGKIVRFPSLLMTITGDHIEEDYKVGDFVQFEHATLKNRKYEDKEGLARWAGELSTVKDTSVSFQTEEQRKAA